MSERKNREARANIADRVVNYFAPVAGARRAAARRAIQVVNSGYSSGGANRSKTWSKGWDDRGGSPREDINLPLSILRIRSRDLYCNGSIARAALRRMRTNVVGSGLILKSQPNAQLLGMDDGHAQNWSRKTEREFAIWADSKDCDITGLDTFGETQALAFLSWLMSGDGITLLQDGYRPGQPYSLRLNLVEADRVCTPGIPWGNAQELIPKLLPNGNRIDQGVEIGPNGNIVAYHVSNFHPLGQLQIGQRQDAQNWSRVPVYGEKSGRLNVIHLIERERPGQYRGVPFISGVIEDLRKISQYTDSELLAAVIASYFTVFVKRNSPDGIFGEGMPEEQLIAKESRTTEEDAAATQHQYEMGPGAVVGMDTDEDIQIANPSRPNANYNGFVEAIATQIGAALEIPYEVLMGRFTASFSASRAALLQAWSMFKVYRRAMITDFCQPIYEEWLTEAVLLGRVNAPGFFDDPIIRAAWCGARWHGPGMGQINPVVEANAAVIRVDNCFSTREQETAEINGGDVDANIVQRGQEEKQRVTAGLVAAPVPAVV